MRCSVCLRGHLIHEKNQISTITAHCRTEMARSSFLIVQSLTQQLMSLRTQMCHPLDLLVA